MTSKFTARQADFEMGYSANFAEAKSCTIVFVYLVTILK